MDLRARNFVAKSIAQDARTETEATYEEQIADYRSRNFTYIPMPEDDQFYNVKEGWLKPISDEQWVEPETHLLDVLKLLQEQQFLLYGSPDRGYKIINVADLNQRGLREMLYPPVAELESLIASRIEDHHSDSEQLLQDMSEEAINPTTIGGWYRDRQNDVELHIAEKMNLTEMKQVLTEGRAALARSCGFDGKGDLGGLNEIRDLRNRVMHANRSLVRSRQDIQEVLARLERIQDLLDEAGKEW